MIEDLVTIEEAARMLGYRSTSGIRVAVSRGELEPDGRGARNKMLFTREALTAFVLARKRAFASPASKANTNGGTAPVSSADGAPIDKRGSKRGRKEDQ